MNQELMHELQQLNNSFIKDINRKLKQIADHPISDEVDDCLSNIRDYIKEWKLELKLLNKHTPTASADCIRPLLN